MNNSMKTPLIRLAKREGMDKRTVWAIRVGSILLALLLGALVIAISGVNPFKAYGTIITGALGKKDRHPPDGEDRRPPVGLRPGHRSMLQDALLEHRRRGSDHGRRHRRLLLRPLLGR